MRACPEIEWLVQCAIIAPSPPEWHKELGRDITLHTGETATEPPLLLHYIEIARILLQACQGPTHALEAAGELHMFLEEVRREVNEVGQQWSGPYIEPESNEEYYYCDATDLSSWERPAVAQEYVAAVVEHLLENTMKINQSSTVLPQEHPQTRERLATSRILQFRSSNI